MATINLNQDRITMLGSVSTRRLTDLLYEDPPANISVRNVATRLAELEPDDTALAADTTTRITLQPEPVSTTKYRIRVIVWADNEPDKAELEITAGQHTWNGTITTWTGLGAAAPAETRQAAAKAIAAANNLTSFGATTLHPAQIRKAKQHFFLELEVTRPWVGTSIDDDIQAGQEHDLHVDVTLAGGNSITKTSTFNTIPDSLETGFSAVAASCYHERSDINTDGTRTAARLFDTSEFANGTALFVQLGDQIYYDNPVAPDFTLAEDTDWIRTRFTNRYYRSWAAFEHALSAAPSVRLTDDHEYWNDYPFAPLAIWTALSVNAGYRRRTATEAHKFVTHIQGVVPFKSFDIGDELTFGFLDARVERTELQFASTSTLNQAITWLSNLQAPAVLFLSQPIFDVESSKQDAITIGSSLLFGPVDLTHRIVTGDPLFSDISDRHLPFYAQYSELADALAAADHDVLVVCGDPHYGRLAYVPIDQPNGDTRTIWELITSPLRLLPSAKAYWDTAGEWSDTIRFRHAGSPDPGQKVYWQHHTDEHPDGGKSRDNVAKLTFSRRPNGGVNVLIQMLYPDPLQDPANSKPDRQPWSIITLF